MYKIVVGATPTPVQVYRSWCCPYHYFLQENYVRTKSGEYKTRFWEEDLHHGHAMTNKRRPHMCPTYNCIGENMSWAITLLAWPNILEEKTGGESHQKVMKWAAQWSSCGRCAVMMRCLLEKISFLDSSEGACRWPKCIFTFSLALLSRVCVRVLPNGDLWPILDLVM